VTEGIAEWKAHQKEKQERLEKIKVKLAIATYDGVVYVQCTRMMK